MTNLVGMVLVILATNTVYLNATNQVGVSCESVGCTNVTWVEATAVGGAVQYEYVVRHGHSTNEVVPVCRRDVVTVGVKGKRFIRAAKVEELTRTSVWSDRVPVGVRYAYCEGGTNSLSRRMYLDVDNNWYEDMADVPLFDIITQTPLEGNGRGMEIYASGTFIRRRGEGE